MHGMYISFYVRLRIALILRMFLVNVYLHFLCCHIYLLLLRGGVWRRAVSPAVVEEVSAEDILQLCEGVFSFTRLQLAFPQDDGVPSQLMESGAGDGVAFCVA